MTEVKLAHLVECSNVKATGGLAPYVALEHVESGTGQLLSGAEIEEREADGVLFESGDVLFGKLRPYLHKVLNPEFSGVCSSEFLVLRPRRGLESRYLYYLALTRRFADWASASSYGVKMPRTSWELLRQLPVGVPGIAEQRAIADYLDTETGRIDALIAKKRRMIELLDERWSAFIRTQVHRLDAPVLPLKRSWTVIDCKHRTPDYVPNGYPVVSPGDISAGRLDLSRAHRFVAKADFDDLTAGGRRPGRGDIIYSRNASIGVASYVDTDEAFSMGQDVCLITSDGQDQLYLSFALNSLGVDQLEEQKIGSTFSRINISQILELRLPTPPPEQQRAVSARLDRERRRIDEACIAIDTQVALLREKRQALVTAAVTGSVSVDRLSA